MALLHTIQRLVQACGPFVGSISVPVRHTHSTDCSASLALQTYEGLAQAFDPEQVQGVQEEVQLREQDFG